MCKLCDELNIKTHTEGESEAKLRAEMELAISEKRPLIIMSTNGDKTETFVHNASMFDVAEAMATFLVTMPGILDLVMVGAMGGPEALQKARAALEAKLEKTEGVNNGAN